MHGLVNRCLGMFLADVHGTPFRDAVWRRARLPRAFGQSFEVEDDALTRRALAEAACLKGCDPEALLEDLGNYLVTHPRMGMVRRLLRFAGADFSDFLLSLEELGERVRLVVPDLGFPDIAVRQEAGGVFSVEVGGAGTEMLAVLAGLIRAMADDYGALVTVERVPEQRILQVCIFEGQFGPGRCFSVAEPGG